MKQSFFTKFSNCFAIHLCTLTTALRATSPRSLFQNDGFCRLHWWCSYNTLLIFLWDWWWLSSEWFQRDNPHSFYKRFIRWIEDNVCHDQYKSNTWAHKFYPCLDYTIENTLTFHQLPSSKISLRSSLPKAT